jgi:DNA polymerase III alpha subunit (gram-positive type)
MVGHDASADLKYLNSLGYDIRSLEKFFDQIDTKDMFQRIQCSNNGRSLGFVCNELDIRARNFHNAGNDAMYTLEAMIAMAVRKKVGGPVTQSEMNGWKTETT